MISDLLRCRGPGSSPVSYTHRSRRGFVNVCAPGMTYIGRVIMRMEVILVRVFSCGGRFLLIVEADML